MAWYPRLRNLTRRDRVDRDIDRELSFHISERVDDLVASGVSEDEARRAAKKQFGNWMELIAPLMARVMTSLICLLPTAGHRYC